MKRRRAIQSLMGLSAAAALPLPAFPQAVKETGQPVPAKETSQPAPARAGEETPALEMTVADAAAPGAPRFFTAEQLSALRRLSGLIMPATGDTPGASEAGAAEFLDFLIGASPQERQALYRQGLDRLNSEAKNRHAKLFADISSVQADTILDPLREPWTYKGPDDPFARFLLAVKDDVITATVNSREWVTTVSKRSRGAGGLGQYWYRVE
jgi:gluconate 2-dehydrogenase subunit 3-like protein